MRFSIITAAWINDEDRAQKFIRCLKSIENQDFDHREIEHIIVNDGSTFPISVPRYPWVKIIDQENLQRITAYNNGFKEASGDILCVLDSDDEYDPSYLHKVDGFFGENPTYKMFHFGSRHAYRDGAVHTRPPFKPKEKEVGHESFGGGNIVWGTFVFSREIYDDLGAFPPHRVENIDCSEINYSNGPRELWMTSPYDFSAWYQMKYPEIREYFMVNHADEPHKIIKELGNPFGNDFALFYQYTRKYHSKPMDDCLYIVHEK